MQKFFTPKHLEVSNAVVLKNRYPNLGKEGIKLVKGKHCFDCENWEDIWYEHNPDLWDIVCSLDEEAGEVEHKLYGGSCEFFKRRE